MNVLILNGSPRKNGNTSHALRAIEDGLKLNHTVESLNVYDFTFRPCPFYHTASHNRIGEPS